MSASRKAALVVGLGVAMLLVVAAGCGGDDGDSAGTTTAPATSAGGPNERLTEAEWAQYTMVRDDAQAANTEATATLKRCRKVLYESEEQTPPSECFGGSMTNLVNTGKETLDFLQAQSSEVSGACATANAELTGYIKLYVASAQALESNIQRNDVSGAQPTIDNAVVALQNTKKAGVAFTAACKPTGSA